MVKENITINTGNQYDVQWNNVKNDLQSKKINNNDNSNVSFKEVVDEIKKNNSQKLPVDTTKAYEPINSEYYLSYIKHNKSRPVVRYGVYFNNKEEVERYAVNIPEEPTNVEKPKTQPGAVMKYGAHFGEIIQPLYAVRVNEPRPVTTQKTSANSGIPIGNYTVPKGMGYEKMIQLALKEQGIVQTSANIQKAKAQFKAANKPGTVHIYNGANAQLKGNEYLWANDKVVIPKFDMNK